MSNNSEETLLASPGVLFHIPESCVRKVEEVEEEIFLLYTLRYAKEEDLGILEQKSDVVNLTFKLAVSSHETRLSNTGKSREITLDVFQNVSALSITQ